MNTQQITEQFKILESRNIYFGHQSVGQNIIDGIQELLNESTETTLQLTAIDDNFSPPDNKGHLFHSAIGENTRPITKCENFSQIIQNTLAGSIDIALLKFCYIDINEDTDVEALFGQYRSVLDSLIKNFPEITFVHVTIPLRHCQSGFGVWIRELLGKPNRSKLANIKRNDFNQMLKFHYTSSLSFDLANSMSTSEDGKLNTFRYNSGKHYPNLIGEYTNDGGHLNETGRNKVATDFVAQLASITREYKS